MKKAILITGIIWLIFCVAGGISEIVVGVSFFSPISNGQVQVDPNPTLAVANIVVGALMFVGAVLDVILIIKRNSDMKKGPGIALGVVAAVLGATLPGILFAVDSGVNRPRE